MVDNVDAGGKQLRVELVLEKTGFARYGAAVDRAREMTDERAGYPRIEHDWHFLGFDLARVEPFDGVLASGTANFLRRFQIAQMQCRGIIVVAFHRGALARD